MLLVFFSFSFFWGGVWEGQGQDWGRILKIHTGVHMSDWVS